MKKTTTAVYIALLLVGLYISIIYFISVWLGHTEVLPFPVEEIEACSIMGFVDSIFAFGMLTGFVPLIVGIFGLYKEFKAWQCAKQRAYQEELLRAQRRAERRARRAERSRY